MSQPCGTLASLVPISHLQAVDLALLLRKPESHSFLELMFSLSSSHFPPISFINILFLKKTASVLNF